MDDDDKDDDDDDGDDAMDATQLDADKDDSLPDNSPTNSEEQMIEATAAHTQNDVALHEVSEESSTGKRPASLPKRKSRSSKKKR